MEARCELSLCDSFSRTAAEGILFPFSPLHSDLTFHFLIYAPAMLLHGVTLVRMADDALVPPAAFAAECHASRACKARAA